MDGVDKVASGYRAAGGRLGVQLHIAPLILHCLIRARTRGVANFNKTAKGCILAGYKHLAAFSVNSTRSSIIRIYTNNKLTAQRAVNCASCTSVGIIHRRTSSAIAAGRCYKDISANSRRSDPTSKCCAF